MQRAEQSHKQDAAGDAMPSRPCGPGRATTTAPTVSDGNAPLVILGQLQEDVRDAPRRRGPSQRTERVSIDSVVRSLASSSRSPANGAETTQRTQPSPAQPSPARGYGVPITYHQQRRQRRAPVQQRQRAATSCRTCDHVTSSLGCCHEQECTATYCCTRTSCCGDWIQALLRSRCL